MNPEIPLTLTFDDVLLEPRYSDVLPTEVTPPTVTVTVDAGAAPRPQITVEAPRCRIIPLAKRPSSRPKAIAGGGAGAGLHGPGLRV